MTRNMDGDNVVSIGSKRRRVLFPALGRVEAYWEGLRNGRAMPARAEVDPRGIADVLQYAFVLERMAPGLARIRLAGMHLNDLMAMEVRGMPISAMFLPDARAEVQRAVQEVMETPAVVRLTLGSDTGFTRPPLEGQMMLLPLRDAQGLVTRILGVLETRGRIGRGPRRFMIRDIETRAIDLTRARSDAPGLGAPGLGAPGLDAPGLGARPAGPHPAPQPVARDRLSGDADAFAPRSRDFASRIAEDGPRTPRPVVKGTGGQPAHLRLVHDADRV